MAPVYYGAIPDIIESVVWLVNRLIRLLFHAILKRKA